VSQITEVPAIRSFTELVAGMTRLKSVLILFAALALSVSFALPAEDMPETGYVEAAVGRS